MKIMSILLGLTISLLSMPLWANDEHISHRHYMVYGNNYQSVSKSLKRNRPDGYNSMNEWHISWQYDFKIKDDQCHMVQPKVKRKVIFILPKLAVGQPLSQSFQKEWQRFSAALIAHQMGHAKFADQAMLAIQAAFDHFPAEKTCQQVKEKANQLARTIIDDYKVKEKAYDKETGSGFTQGAVLRDVN